MSRRKTAALKARPWNAERLTTPARPMALVEYDRAPDGEKRQLEGEILATVRARAAAMPLTPDNNPHLGVVAAADVPATLVRGYVLLDRYAATRGPVDQGDIDAWAHELTEVVSQLKGAKSAAYEPEGLDTERRRALRLQCTPKADLDKANWICRVLAAAGHDPGEG